MINAFYTAKSGTKNYQSFLDAVSNNIANVSTPSYKSQSVSFTDLMYTNFQGTDGKELQNGSGSRILVTRDMSQGPAQRSDDPNDVIIKGDGYFAVQDSTGTVAYTRTSSFSVAEIGGVNYLVNNKGDFVLDPNLNKITVNTEKPVTFLSPGEALSLADVDKQNAITVGVFSFSDPEKLIASGDGKYVIGNGITAALDTKSDLVANMAESSNVDLVTEMARMITAQRGFQINANMIQTADEMEQYANNLGN